MEIVDGIHRIETETGGKHLFLYVLELADGLLLIDTGESHHPEEAIFPFLEAHNWAPTDLRWVFITHADVDHFGGNHIIRAAAPQATFACHNQDRGWVGSRERTLAEHYNRYKTRYGVSYPDEVQDWLRSAMGPDVPVELGFVGGENIEIKDGRELVVLHTPGHTPGHLVILINSLGEKAMIMGDVLHSKAQVNEPGWTAGVDIDKEASRRSRNDILDLAEREGYVVAAGHSHPIVHIGKVVRLEGRRYWQAL